MTDNELIEKQHDALEAMARLGDIFTKPRKGIVVTLNGARVGTWTWSPGRFMLSGETKEFKRMIVKLNQEGIIVQVPVAVKGPSEEKIAGHASSFTVVSLKTCAPGTVDHYLKQLGYYIIDTEVA